MNKLFLSNEEILIAVRDFFKCIIIFGVKLFLANIIVVVVALVFYVHGKHLRSCRDGQLT